MDLPDHRGWKKREKDRRGSRKRWNKIWRGKWSAEGILLVFQIPKVQCASKSGRFPLAANRFRIFSRDSRIRNARMPSRAWKMAQLPSLFQFSVKGNKFSLEREDTIPKILRCKFSDRINRFDQRDWFWFCYTKLYEQC